MIHILLLSHGGMAEGMMQSVRMIMGEQPYLDYVTFDETMGLEALDESIGAKLHADLTTNQYLIFCDIIGGTPFNVVSRYSYKNESIAVIYGMNLPLLVEALIRRNGEKSLDELCEYLHRQGKDTIGLSEF